MPRKCNEDVGQPRGMSSSVKKTSGSAKKTLKMISDTNKTLRNDGTR
jgi:hypothetical protein